MWQIEQWPMLQERHAALQHEAEIARMLHARGARAGGLGAALGRVRTRLLSALDQ